MHTSTARDGRLIAVVAVSILALLSSCHEPSSAADRRNCQQQLRSLWAAIALHRQEHANRWPKELDSLDQELVGRLLSCPGAVKDSGMRNLDYLYVDWSRRSSDAEQPVGKRPLVYDRRAKNHGGRGVNILMVDGTVEWDANSEWLKRFAAEHTNLQLTVPE